MKTTNTHLSSPNPTNPTISIPKMVVSKAMLNAPLELPHVPAPILARVHPTAMALATCPLPGINIAGVKPVDPEPVAKPLAVLPPVPTPPGPRLHPKAIVLPLYPVPLIPPTHAVVVNPAPTTLPSPELPLVNVAVRIRNHGELKLGLGGPGPEHGELERGPGLGLEEESEGGDSWQSEVEREEESGREEERR